jgi:hypothetical protein
MRCVPTHSPEAPHLDVLLIDEQTRTPSVVERANPDRGVHGVDRSTVGGSYLVCSVYRCGRGIDLVGRKCETEVSECMDLG